MLGGTLAHRTVLDGRGDLCVGVDSRVGLSYMM